MVLDNHRKSNQPKRGHGIKERNLLQDGVRQTGNILLVQIRCRFVERQDAAFAAERFRKSHADDERGENFLPGTASTPHVHLDSVLTHDDAVVVRPSHRSCKPKM